MNAPPGFEPVGAAVPPGFEPVEEEVLNEQRVSDSERTALNNFGLGPASQVKWLQDRGLEAGLDEQGVKVRRPGEPTWGRIEPQGFLAGKGFWGKAGELVRDFTQDAGDELALAGGTTVGSLAAGPFGAGAGAATVEAARRTLAAGQGFEETPGEFLGGVGTEALLGTGSELGARAIGATVKGARNLLRGPAVEAAAPPAGLLKPIVAEAGEAAGTKPEVAAYKEALSGRAAAPAEGGESAAEGLLKPLAPVPARAAAEAGGEAVEAVPGLLKSPDELDALLKPPDVQARFRVQPGEATTPPGMSPDWTPGHVAGSSATKAIQESAREIPPSALFGGPITVVKSSRDQVRKLLEDAGDKPVRILAMTVGKKGKESVPRLFENARLADRGPKFLGMEGEQSIKAQVADMSDQELLQMIREGGEKGRGAINSLTDQEMKFFGTSDIDRLGREQLELLAFRRQPGVVQGKHAIKKMKDGSYDYSGQDTKHNFQRVWEQTGKSLEDGQFRGVQFDKILEIEIDGQVYRVAQEGVPFFKGAKPGDLVPVGTRDEIPIPTEVIPGPGLPPMPITTGAKTEPAGLLKSAPGRPVKPAAATPQDLAARGIMPPGPMGKAAEFGESLLNIPKGIAGGIQKMTGLGPAASKGLLMGADFLSTGGMGTAARIGGGLAVKGLKRIDAIFQPGGLAREIQRAPAAVRPALEGILHQLETKGDAAGRAALYIAVKSVGGGPLREWLENEETPQGGVTSP